MQTIKNQFPIFDARPGLVYLDSAATALTPISVIDAVSSYYGTLSANVGRGLYALSEWGYTPGVVRDVIREALEKGGPMKKDEIMKHHDKLIEGKSLTSCTLTNIYLQLHG